MTVATPAATGVAPPHSLEAEQSVLGGILLSDRAMYGLVIEEGLKPEHFFRDGHRAIFEAMLALYGREVSIDVLTVSVELEQAGRLEIVGGKSAIDALTGGVPGLGGIRRYAQIVIERALTRGLLRASYEIQASIVNHTAPPRELVEQAEQAIRDVAATVLPVGVADGYLGPDVLADHMMAWLEEEPDEGLALPAELPAVARKVRLRVGHLTVLAAWPSCGKALALDTPVPSPGGWRTMGDLQAGDRIYGSDGAPTIVTHAWPVRQGRPCYCVRFRDGSEIVADEDHLWTVYTRASRRSEVAAVKRTGKPLKTYGSDQSHRRVHPVTVTTRELRKMVTTSDRSISIPAAGPVQRPRAKLPVDPYVLGYWLGDGTSSCAALTVGAPDIEHVREQLTSAGLRYTAREYRPGVYTVAFGAKESGRCLRGHPSPKYSNGCRVCQRLGGLDDPIINVSAQTRLREIGVLGDKHIPSLYLNASIEQRWALLQGLMDSDGTIGRDYGKCTFAVCRRKLAESALDLMLGLGLRPIWNERPAKLAGREVGRSYMITFKTTRSPFRLARKVARMPMRVTSKSTHRAIVSVDPVQSVPVRCITVDAPDNLYLVGRSHIATHNTSTALQFAAAAGAAGARVVVWSNEDTAEELVAKHVMSATGVPSSVISDRRLSDARLPKVIAALGHLPFEVQPCHDWTAAQIATHIRQVRPALAIVDHFHNLAQIGKVSEIDEAIRVLAAAAGQAPCHLILCAQLNRARMSGVCKPPPVAADLRGSGMFLAAAHTMLLVHRDEEEIETDGAKTGKAVQLESGSIDVAKNKVTGRTGVVRVTFDEKRLRFIEEAAASPAGATEGW